MTGKMINMDTMPLRWGHYRVLIVASMGQIIGAGLATLVGNYFAYDTAAPSSGINLISARARGLYQFDRHHFGFVTFR